VQLAQAVLPQTRGLTARIGELLRQPVPGWVSAAVLFIWCANILDFFLTIFNISNGATEANPLLAHFFHTGNYMTAFLLKNAMTLGGLTMLALFSSRSRGTLFAFTLICVSYAVLILYHLSHIVIL